MMWASSTKLDLLEWNLSKYSQQILYIYIKPKAISVDAWKEWLCSKKWLGNSCGFGVLRLNRKRSKMQIKNVVLGNEESGVKTLKEILLSKNDGGTLGQKPKQPLRKTAESRRKWYKGF